MLSPSELQSLLQRCKADPLDDALRLALAERLDATDPTRAEFIRLQLLPIHPGDDWVSGRASGRTRELRLLRQFAPAWINGRFTHSSWFRLDEAPAYDEEGPGVPTGQFERGLIKICASAPQLEELLARLPEHAIPWLETLDLGSLADHDTFRRLFTRKAMGSFTRFSLSWDEEDHVPIIDLLDCDHVRGLSLMGEEGGEPLLRRLAGARSLRPHALYVSPVAEEMGGWEAITASPVLGEVRSLECSIPSDTPALDLLARARHLTRLTDLSLFGDDFPTRPLRELLGSTALAGLTQLQVCGYSGNISGVASVLATSGSIRRLERLDLGFNSIDEEEAKALFRSPVVQTLRSLDFGSAELSPEAARALAASPVLANLESLDLSCTGIGDVGLIAIARSPHLRGLRRLSVCRCGITDAGLKALAASPYLTQLVDLDLSINPLGPQALDALASASQLNNLRSLGLRQLRLDPSPFSRLLRSPVTSRLEMLDLQGTPLRRAHIKALADSPMLGGLEELVLHDNALPLGEIDDLMRAPWLDNLVELNLGATGLDDASIEMLTRRLNSGRLGSLDFAGNAINDRGAQMLLEWPGLSHLVSVSLYKNPVDEELVKRVEAVVRGDTVPPSSSTSLS